MKKISIIVLVMALAAGFALATLRGNSNEVEAGSQTNTKEVTETEEDTKK